MLINRTKQSQNKKNSLILWNRDWDTISKTNIWKVWFFFVKFWQNCFYDVLRFTYLLGLQHQQIRDIFAGFMAVCYSFISSLFFLREGFKYNFADFFVRQMFSRRNPEKGGRLFFGQKKTFSAPSAYL